MIYLIADLHWNHNKILEYTNRPFNSIEEMNNVLLENNNSTVTDNDTVYWLGDNCLNISADQERSLYSKFNGYKILVRGNHDKRSNSFYLDSGFAEVHDSLVLPYKDYTFLLTHIPNHVNWHSKNRNWKPVEVEGENVVNIHGHLHNTFFNSILDKSKYYCVSVENINYTPINIERLYNIMSYKNNYINDIRAGINIGKLTDAQFKKIFGFNKE